MDFETKIENQITIVKPLNPNIDATVSTEFKGKVIDLIIGENKYFLLNLSLVNFVDSSGLGAIISILKTVKMNNGEIVICEMHQTVLNLFKLTRLDQVFKILADESLGLAFLLDLKKKEI